VQEGPVNVLSPMHAALVPGYNERNSTWRNKPDVVSVNAR
jgi:hypothetical protein